MVRLDVHEAKTHLSRYLRQLEEDGETIVLCRHNRPIAEIRRVGEGKSLRRVFGLDEGRVVLLPAFFEPLDEETLGHFGGERG